MKVKTGTCGICKGEVFDCTGADVGDDSQATDFRYTEDGRTVRVVACLGCVYAHASDKRKEVKAVPKTHHYSEEAERVRRKLAAAILTDDEAYERLQEAMKWRGWGMPLVGEERARTSETRTVREIVAFCARLSEVTGIDFEVYT